MSNIAEVRATVDGHLNEMEQTLAKIIDLSENLGANAQSVRTAVDRTRGYSSHRTTIEALFGPGVAIHTACTELSEAIATMRTVTGSW